MFLLNIYCDTAFAMFAVSRTGIHPDEANPIARELAFQPALQRAVLLDRKIAAQWIMGSQDRKGFLETPVFEFQQSFAGQRLAEVHLQPWRSSEIENGFGVSGPVRVDFFGIFHGGLEYKERASSSLV